MLGRLFEDAQCLSLSLSFASPLCFVVAVCLTQTLSQFWVLDESPYLNGMHSKHAGKNKSQQCLSLPYQVVFSSTCSLGNQVIKPVSTSLLITSGESPVNSLRLIHYFVRATRWLTSEQARMFAFNKGFFPPCLPVIMFLYKSEKKIWNRLRICIGSKVFTQQFHAEVHVKLGVRSAFNWT